MKFYFSIQVLQHPKIPALICARCVSRLGHFSSFRLKIREVDEYFNKLASMTEQETEFKTEAEVFEEHVVEVYKSGPEVHCSVITWIEDPKDFPDDSRMDIEVVDVYREKPM